MKAEGLKRFYDSVSVRGEGDNFTVLVDARRLKTPAGNLLKLPNRTLAEAVAREWDAQEDRVRPDRMPLTRMINTAVDQTAARPLPVVDRLTAYGETDLLCHWADYPEELIIRQRTEWEPLLEWAASVLGVRLVPVTGIRPHPQAVTSLDALRRHLNALDPISLTAADTVASVTGSVILTLALAFGRLNVAQAWRISRIDEDYQMEKWGEDAEARRLAEVRREALDVAAMVFAALQPHPGAGARREN